ncbi:hypothetical protein brsh051_09970 [Brooklawnia propionicigenes]|uniref:Uncharacterized protein n=1 Tax=Brooklawnia propionicigenes TaxID=3041175 RepID=A0AAN0K7P0_9ACTN|nr:hypothetical protein brsh051_09970 [Brooklawnia sp. SH051]
MPPPGAVARHASHRVGDHLVPDDVGGKKRGTVPRPPALVEAITVPGQVRRSNSTLTPLTNTSAGLSDSPSAVV